MTGYYGALQISIWADICVSMTFAAVYLGGTGHSNAAIGIILAAGNLLGAALGPWISSAIDKHREITPVRLMPYIIGARAIAIAVIFADAGGGWLTDIFYVLFMAMSLCANTLILKIYVDADYSGVHIDFGIGRGLGSAAYVVVSSLLGIIVRNTSVRAIIWAGIIIWVYQVAAFILFRMKLKSAAAGAISAASLPGEKGSVQASGLIRFAADNKRFCLLLLGIFLVFYSHSTLGSFMINVVENVGGDTGDMGFMNAFMALVEIPAVMFYTKFFGSKDRRRILRIAFIFFAFKAIGAALATNLAMLAAAMVLQAPSFGLYTPAIVLYTSEVVRHEDSAKAQSLVFSMTTLGSVFASLISGALLDIVSVRMTMAIAAAVCVAGTAVAIMSIQKKPSEQ